MSRQKLARDQERKVLEQELEPYVELHFHFFKNVVFNDLWDAYESTPGDPLAVAVKIPVPKEILERNKKL